jgi:hypothetical protein
LLALLELVTSYSTVHRKVITTTTTTFTATPTITTDGYYYADDDGWRLQQHLASTIKEIQAEAFNMNAQLD